MTMDAADSARLGLNLNLSVQPQSHHWIQSPKGTDDEDEDERRRGDDDCSPEEEPDILEMQREERETLNQLARRLASGSHGLMGGHTASMIQHLVYRHPNGIPSSDQIILPMSSRRPADVESPAGSSRSGDTPLGHDYPSESDASLLARKGEAQSWTFEEQFRQLYTAGNETDRRSFLDSLFSYMQEQGTPISRLPIMAKRVLDLYTLYKLVVQRGGIVAVITKKLWQEIIRGLGLPPSITSAAFTLRTQYVKYLYAYESKMNQFSTVDELNMAIAGNRREGRRNKSLLSEYLPALPVSSAGGHHHMPSALASPGSSAAAHHNQYQQQQQHYANVLAADDRFRHLAAAIIDNRHRAAEHHARQQQQQPSSSSSSSRPASPQRLAQLPLPGVVDPSTFNGHLQPPSYQSASMIAAHQAAVAGDHTNKQREILSMLMWMDLMRANQTAIPRLPIPNLQQQSSQSPYSAAASPMNVQQSPIALRKAPAPEQCEALNLGKKNHARTTTNNNNAGENDEEPPSAKRIKAERSPSSSPPLPPPPPPPPHQTTTTTTTTTATTTAVTAVPAAETTGPKAETAAAKPETIRPRTETSSPRAEPNSPRAAANSPRAAANDAEAGSPPAAGSPVPELNSPDPRSPGGGDDAIEMDIDVSTGVPNGLKICVCKRTKHGIYKGQLVKVESSLNGGMKNTSPFILRLNGELYTGCLQLLQNTPLNHNDDNKNIC